MMDFESESSLEEDDIENELYSILHFADFSQGVPEELNQKYDIQCDLNGHVKISLKSDNKQESEMFCENELVDKIVEHPKTLENSKQKNVSYMQTEGIPLITISDDSDDDDVIINTAPPAVIDLTDIESDFVGSTNSFNWKELQCPPSWTKYMRKFYNKPSLRLKHFNHVSIIKKLRAQNIDWSIKNADLLPIFRAKPKCGICNMKGHLPSECTNRVRNCYICGTSGHVCSDCPEAMCLNCGNESHVFRSACNRCINMENKLCDICKKKGHFGYLCTDSWRKFHSTTGERSSQTFITKNTQKGRKACCNCAKEGHIYEECPKLFMFCNEYDGKEWKRNNRRIIYEEKKLHVFIPHSVDTTQESFQRLVETFQEKGLVIRRVQTRKAFYLKAIGSIGLAQQFKHKVLQYGMRISNQIKNPMQKARKFKNKVKRKNVYDRNKDRNNLIQIK